MEEEVDSLDHIKALYNQPDQRRTNRADDEPVYQISSNGESGHSASFGAGGRISQVIDPSFRAPITSTVQPQTHLFGSVVSQDSDQALKTFASVQREATSNVRENCGFSSNALVSTVTTTNAMNSLQSTSSSNINPIYPASSSLSSIQSTFYTSGYLSTNSLTNANSTTDYRSSNNVPTGAQTNAISSIPFLSSSEATSFSHLAKKHAGPSPAQFVSSSSNTVTSSTLHEYGPPITLAARQPVVSQLSYMTPTSLASISSRPFGPYELSSRVTETTHQAPTPLPPPPPPPQQHPSTSRINGNNDDSRLSRPLSFIPSTTRSLHVSCPPPPKNPRSDDGPLFSPPAPNISASPPLDTIPNSVRTDNPIPHTHNKSSNSDAPSGKIPKIQKAITISDKYDEYSMLELIEKHDSLKSKLSFVERRRQDIEKSLNDMARTSQGKNVELDATFRQRKDEQRRCQEELGELQSDIKKVSNKLLTKYNHRVTDTQSNTSAPNPPPSRQRARMSTGSSKLESRYAEPEKRTSVKEREKFLLTLTSNKIWCKLCDVHLDDFSEYCEHLHKRTHIMRRNPTHPWRRSKSTHDKRKTYDTLKSICAIVSNEVGSNSFSLARYEKSLNPHLDDKDKKLKSYFTNRERGRFEDDDPLFSLKGYQNLVPINGFYCQLCDQAVCDAVAAEQHVRGFEHNFKHAKSVARDHMSEETFRSNQIKSYKKQNASQLQSQKDPPEQLAQKNPIQTNPTTAVAASSSSFSSVTTTKSFGQKLPRAHALPIAQYKKPTSHIVDNHEVIVDKFTNRPLSADQGTKSGASKPKHRALVARAIIESDSEEASKEKTTMGELDYSEDDEESVRRAVRKENSPRKKKSFKRNIMPEILPIQDSRSKPSALKRLKCTSEKARLNREKPYFSSSESEASENDLQILAEIHLNKGDPESPFPGLDLVVTGNVHSAVLKDPRLAKDGKVLMNRINIEDFKDLVMDSTTLWTRINHLMTKKEPAQLERLKNSLREKVSTRPTYFDVDGELLPINMEGEGSVDGSETDIEEEGTIEGFINEPFGDVEKPLKETKRAGSVSTEEDFCDALNSITKSSRKDIVLEACEKRKNVVEHEGGNVEEENDENDDNEAEMDKLSKEIDAAFEDDKADGGGFSMHLLEDFFCEKPK